MTTSVRMAFEPDGLVLPVEQILPVRTLRPEGRKSPQFQRLLASVRELGVVEPLIVHRQASANGDVPRYTLLDGHSRLEILKELGRTEVFCLVASDDEAFTYNHKVNQISPIQEHFMVMKALENGVSEERIARTLNVDVGAIRQKRNLLAGVCPEAVEILKSRQISAAAIREVKKATPMRQIEMAELMVAASNYSTTYAKCLVAATPERDLAPTEKAKATAGLRPEDVARMEREMEALSQDFRLVEETHGKNTLNLVLAVGYLRRLMEHANTVRYLSQRYPDILAEFQKLIETPDLKGS